MFARYYNPTAIVSVVGQPVAFADGEGLNMKIQITRSLEQTPDRCVIDIEGLDPIRAQLMGQVFRETSLGQIVTVQLGYDAVAVSAFTGRLEAFSPSQPNGPALWTHAEAGDAPDEFENIRIPIQSTTSLTASNMVDLGIAALGLLPGPSVAPTVAGAALVAATPFDAVGVRQATDLLDEAARILRCRWWMRDGMVHMSRNGIPDPSRLAIIIAPSGPGPVFPGVPLIAQPRFGGGGLIEVPTFMEPDFVPGGQAVYLGTTFRIEHVVHSIETRGAAPWSSTVVGRAL